MRTSRNRQFALGIGVVWATLGLLGVLFASDGLLFGVMTVGPAQNLIHLIAGLALGSAAIGGTLTARRANLLLGVLALALGMLGLFTSGTGSDLLALNGAGNVLHFGTAAVLLIAALGTDRDARR